MAKKATTKGIGVGKRTKTTVTMRPSQEWSAEPQTIMRVDEVAQMISEGKSRQTCQQWIKDTYGVQDRQARAYYSAALRLLIPDESKFDEYRKALVQANIDRLEKIIEVCIESNDANMLSQARQCIAELNKMFGLTDKNNTVMINKDADGDEQIVITFEK